MARYYDEVAGTMLRHVKGRPLNLQRFPDGIDGEDPWRDVRRHAQGLGKARERPARVDA